MCSRKWNWQCSHISVGSGTPGKYDAHYVRWCFYSGLAYFRGGSNRWWPPRGRLSRIPFYFWFYVSRNLPEGSKFCTHSIVKRCLLHSTSLTGIPYDGDSVLVAGVYSQHLVHPPTSGTGQVSNISLHCVCLTVAFLLLLHRFLSRRGSKPGATEPKQWKSNAVMSKKFPASQNRPSHEPALRHSNAFPFLMQFPNAIIPLGNKPNDRPIHRTRNRRRWAINEREFR